MNKQKQERNTRMKKEKITFDYDEETDILYVSFGKPQKAITEEKRGIAVRRNEKTGFYVRNACITSSNSREN